MVRDVTVPVTAAALGHHVSHQTTKAMGLVSAEDTGDGDYCRYSQTKGVWRDV